jgi:hypothetical protein
MSEISAPPPAVLPSAKKPVLDGWRLIAIIAAFVILVAALVLRHHRVTKLAPQTSSAEVAVPAWPLKAGDVFVLKPGDPIIAKWADEPDSSGMVVQEIEQDGDTVTDGNVCTLQPDYMADANQPGGTLTLLSQDGAGDWQVRWSGGPTRDSEVTTGAANVSCGTTAVVLMSLAQLHSWWNMQSGIFDAEPVNADSNATTTH